MFTQHSFYLVDHGEVVDYHSLDEYINTYKEVLIENPWDWKTTANLVSWELNGDKQRLELTYTVDPDGEIQTHVEYVDYKPITVYMTIV